ncbi:MAG: hypothetical protein K2N13_10330 [Paraprevotella sp.]|nr:hypothetical protein [Paraprevotella sp.]
MKQICFFFFLLWGSWGVKAQQYPSEWVKYTYSGYLYDIQSDSNDRNLSETDFKNYLLNIARTNLAKQIQVRVQDVAELNKQSINGRTSVTYSSSTNFSTDVNLKLVETRATYNSISKMGYVIAYIDKEVARNYYKNELTLVYNKINNSIALAENFVSAGFKTKAQTELKASLKHFALIDKPLFWMNIFGASQSELAEWQERFNMAEQGIKRMLADLKHATVICLSCTADIFGKPYPTLQNELKGILATGGCSFTENPADADWVITITCEAREHSNVNIGKTSSYFSYVDAQIVINKVITSQRIYEDEISVKGGHTFGYSEAAKAGYKEIKQKIGEIIKNNIKQ